MTTNRGRPIPPPQQPCERFRPMKILIVAIAGLLSSTALAEEYMRIVEGPKARFLHCTKGSPNKAVCAVTAIFIGENEQDAMSYCEIYKEAVDGDQDPTRIDALVVFRDVFSRDSARGRPAQACSLDFRPLDSLRAAPRVTPPVLFTSRARVFQAVA